MQISESLEPRQKPQLKSQPPKLLPNLARILPRLNLQPSKPRVKPAQPRLQRAQHKLLVLAKTFAQIILTASINTKTVLNSINVPTAKPSSRTALLVSTSTQRATAIGLKMSSAKKHLKPSAKNPELENFNKIHLFISFYNQERLCTLYTHDKRARTSRQNYSFEM